MFQGAAGERTRGRDFSTARKRLTRVVCPVPWPVPYDTLAHGVAQGNPARLRAGSGRLAGGRAVRGLAE